MHRVIAYIDDHLDDAIDLNTLAAVAHFSPFHFHRLFASWMGETFGDYLRRRRVEVAAMRLAAQPGVSILSLALSVGFGSGEAFSRAFKVRMGCSPTAWREQQVALRRAARKMGQADRKLNQDAATLFPQQHVFTSPFEETSMQVTVINREPATVAYLRHLGPYGETISRFWQEAYVPWAITNRLGPEHARYGISYDDPSVTAPEQCRYDACAEVSPEFIATGGAQKTTIPGGRYAVLPFHGTASEIGEAWASLLRDWLPSSGLQLDARPCFEYYPKGAAYDHATGKFSCEICIPVMPL